MALVLSASAPSFFTFAQACPWRGALDEIVADPQLLSALEQVLRATEHANDRCAEPEIEAHLSVLRSSDTVEGAFLVGECLAHRGDLLGAWRVWQRAAEPARSGLSCLTSTTAPQTAAKSLKQVALRIPQLQLPDRLAAGTLVIVRGFGGLSSCSGPEGCELRGTAPPRLVNPGRYRLAIRPPGHIVEDFALGREFSLKPGETFRVPKQWILSAYIDALLCEELESEAEGRGAAAVATCYARLGDVARSARWWTRMLRWVDAELETPVRKDRRAELIAIRQTAQRSFDDLPSLRVVGALAKGDRLLLQGRSRTGTQPSCASSPCPVLIARDTPLSFGSYVLRVIRPGNEAIHEVYFVLDSARPDQTVTLPAFASPETDALPLLGAALATAGTSVLLGRRAVTERDECRSGKGCALPWAIATDVLAISSAWFLYKWIDAQFLSPEPSTRRVSGACGLHSCGITYGGQF